MRLPEEPDTPPQIYIVPMIDVIFALLTFFIMSTLYLTRSEGLPVNLPKATTSQRYQNTAQITITLDQQGRLALNRQPTQLNALARQVKALISPNQQIEVIINADERVTHGQVVAVMDQVRQVPGVRLAIATTRG